MIVLSNHSIRLLKLLFLIIHSFKIIDLTTILTIPKIIPTFRIQMVTSTMIYRMTILNIPIRLNILQTGFILQLYTLVQITLIIHFPNLMHLFLFSNYNRYLFLLFLYILPELILYNSST